MTLNNYSSFCDDFYLDMYVNTELDLPSQSDTILTFFERIQKQFPSMGEFYRREDNEYCLQEDRQTGQYRWITLEVDRIASGLVNPERTEDAYDQHRLVLELIPYMLGVTGLDIDSLDVTFAMDFDYAGNHDELIAEALLARSAFDCFLDLPQARTVGFSPSLVVALSDDCHTQARISVDSRTSLFEPRKQKHSPDEAIGLSFTVRQYPASTQKFDALKSFEYQCQMAEELMTEKVLPNFVKPLTSVISQKRLT